MRGSEMRGQEGGDGEKVIGNTIGKVRNRDMGLWTPKYMLK